MNITCIQKRIVLDEDPGDGLIFVRAKPHKDFQANTPDGTYTMQCITEGRQRQYKLPYGFNPKKIIGAQFVPAPHKTEKDNDGEREQAGEAGGREEGEHGVR